MSLSCSDWALSHSHTIEYLEILINRGCIAPAQADYIIKKILIDESGKSYNTDINPNACGFDIWFDIQNIEGYFGIG